MFSVYEWKAKASLCLRAQIAKIEVCVSSFPFSARGLSFNMAQQLYRGEKKKKKLNIKTMYLIRNTELPYFGHRKCEKRLPFCHWLKV